MLTLPTSSPIPVEAASSAWCTSLDGLGSSWDRLAIASSTAHPQYLLDWVQPWWCHVGSRVHSLCCVQVVEGGETAAIAPFMLVRRRIKGVVPWRELAWLASGPTDQSDILTGSDAAAMGAKVAEHLARNARRWDELRLQCVPADSKAVQSLLRELEGRVRCTVSTKPAPCYFIETADGDWERYLETTSKKFVRRDLPRIERRLAELGRVEMRQRKDLTVAEILGVVSGIHGARQEELGRTSIFGDPSLSAFVVDALERFRARGILSVWCLYVDAQIAAYLIGFKTGGVFYAWNMAHNPDFGSASPGKVLWARVIRACFEDDGIREFNMMRGDTDYKLKWTNTSRDLLDIRVRNLESIRSSVVNKLRRPA
jgi:CelD/BcsL family acetyltransferase involved in cellulose biosynthesis